MLTGRYFSCAVPSGEVEISAETVPNIMNLGLALLLMGKPKLTIMAVPGEIHFIEVGVNNSGGPALASVESGIGQSLVEKALKMETLENE
jgi:hypothetical protein